MASFLMEDVATCVSLCSTDVTSVVAVTRSGVLHLYRHQLNGYVVFLITVCSPVSP